MLFIILLQLLIGRNAWSEVGNMKQSDRTKADNQLGIQLPTVNSTGSANGQMTQKACQAAAQAQCLWNHRQVLIDSALTFLEELTKAVRLAVCGARQFVFIDIRGNSAFCYIDLDGVTFITDHSSRPIWWNKMGIDRVIPVVHLAKDNSVARIELVSWNFIIQQNLTVFQLGDQLLPLYSKGNLLSARISD
jgi:hypothetical protein